MGKPLYTTTLLARHATETAQPEPAMPTYPAVEKWSVWNAFDPDSDEFFEADNVVYEAFLSEEEVAERAQAQHRETARLLAERLLREANSNSSSATTSEDSDGSTVGNEIGDVSHLPVAQLEVNVGTYAPASEDPSNRGDVSETRANPQSERQSLRRQPRRAPAITEWHVLPTGDISPASSAEAVIPRISVVPAGSRENEQAPRENEQNSPRSASPEPPNTISGLQYVSDSPRPLLPTESPRSISPIPDTPARVSGVFGSPPSSGRAGIPPSPAPTISPRILTWSPRIASQWVSDNPTTGEVSHYLGSLIPSAPTPLTY